MNCKIDTTPDFARDLKQLAKADEAERTRIAIDFIHIVPVPSMCTYSKRYQILQLYEAIALK